jgi:hypothetical protein
MTHRRHRCAGRVDEIESARNRERLRVARAMANIFKTQNYPRRVDCARISALQRA